MRKIFIVFTFFVSFLFLITGVAYAKKHLPTRSGSKAVGVGTSVKFRRDRRAILVYFSNLRAASSVEYMLSYNSRGTTQGAAGSINPQTSPTTGARELLFGTCSHGVCRYDSGITNAKFVVTISLSSGKKIIRTYRLKV